MSRNIEVVWAEPASGPGWSNTPIRAIIRRSNGVLEDVWLQPENQTDLMRELFTISAIVNSKLIKEFEKVKNKAQ